MKNYIIEATETTPQITGNIAEGTLSIIGRSYAEDSISFFDPLSNWLSHFYESNCDSLDVTLDLEYMNTSSGKVLVKLLKELYLLNNQKKVTVVWKYESDDLDMEELGENFNFLVGDMLRLEPKSQMAS